jgi:hypothetical protein
LGKREVNEEVVLAHALEKRAVIAATRFMMKLAKATDPAQKFTWTT